MPGSVFEKLQLDSGAEPVCEEKPSKPIPLRSSSRTSLTQANAQDRKADSAITGVAMKKISDVQSDEREVTQCQPQTPAAVRLPPPEHQFPISEPLVNGDEKKLHEAGHSVKPPLLPKKAALIRNEASVEPKSDSHSLTERPADIAAECKMTPQPSPLRRTSPLSAKEELLDKIVRDLAANPGTPNSTSASDHLDLNVCDTSGIPGDLDFDECFQGVELMTEEEAEKLLSRSSSPDLLKEPGADPDPPQKEPELAVTSTTGSGPCVQQRTGNHLSREKVHQTWKQFATEYRKKEAQRKMPKSFGEMIPIQITYDNEPKRETVPTKHVTTPQKKRRNAFCPSIGCDGKGHFTGRQTRHFSRSGCPLRGIPTSKEALQERWETHYFTEDGWIPFPKAGRYVYRSPIRKDRAFENFQTALSQRLQTLKMKIRDAGRRMRDPVSGPRQQAVTSFLQETLLHLKRTREFERLVEDCTDLKQEFLYHILKLQQHPVRIDQLESKIEQHLFTSPDEFVQELLRLREQIDQHFGATDMNGERIRRIIEYVRDQILWFRIRTEDCYVNLVRLPEEDVDEISTDLQVNSVPVEQQPPLETMVTIKQEKQEPKRKLRYLPPRDERDKANTSIWLLSNSNKQKRQKQEHVVEIVELGSDSDTGSVIPLD